MEHYFDATHIVDSTILRSYRSHSLIYPCCLVEQQRLCDVFDVCVSWNKWTERTFIDIDK